MDMVGRQTHIVLFPFMAQGHIIPFLTLAQLIKQRHPSLAVTLVNTPINIQALRSSLPPASPSTIHLQSLPFNSADHGLPPNSENTDSLTIQQRARFNLSSGSLQPHFERFLSDLTTNNGGSQNICVIADVFFGWTVEIAKKLGLYHATFSTCGAYGTAGYFSQWLNLPHTRTDSPEFGLPGFPEGFRLHRSQTPWYLRVTTADDPWTVFFQRQITLSLGSNAILCNTVEELETEGLRLLTNNTGLQVWTIGPLLPLEKDLNHLRAGKKAGIHLESCIMQWLGAHPPASVLYVSFGSQNTISASQMMALARGLEASGAPFIWVIRPPLGFGMSEEFREEWLPEGFEARMRESRRGVLVKAWAPQLEILSDGSTGAFLSHCGWNSALESLSRGVPVIGWPLGADQFFNSKMMEEELGVCVELTRGTEDGLQSGDVERVIRVVMSSDTGKEMRERAAKLRERIRAANAMREEGDDKGSSLKAIDDFIQATISQSSCSN